MRTISFLLLLLLPIVASGEKLNEKHYQKLWCSSVGGVMEVRLSDGGRVDCVTSEYVYEVEFARKWAEAVGQSLYYAQATGKKPGIVLIAGADDDRFVQRLLSAATATSISVWKVTP